MTSWIHTPEIASLLETLHADAAVNDPRVREEAEKSGQLQEGGFYHVMRHAYLAVGRDLGRLLYNLTRASRAQTVVEFGTSFGISSIYLASALRDNGSGRLITTEFEPEKAERARKNLASAGLDSLVDIRVGDALQTLSTTPEKIDLLFLDGAKDLYLGVLRLLEPRLSAGAIIVSDNTDHDGMEPFLAYLRDPAHGYTSSAILTDGRASRGHEITIRN